MQRDQKLNYMTQYRGLAIIMIIMVHCTTRYLDHSNYLFNYIYALFANSTDIFLFISGFLFEHLLYKKYAYKEFMLKKMKRLIIPYLFWALPVSLFFFVWSGFDFSYLGYTLFTGFSHVNIAHWYIPFIFFVFAISPIFSLLQKKKILYPLILPIFLFISLTTERCSYNLWYGQIMFLNLIGFFFLGMFFSHHKEILVEGLYHLDWLFLAVGLAIVIYKGYYNPTQPENILDAINEYLYGNITINWYALNKLFLSIGFLLFFYRLDKNKLSSKMLSKIAHYSFGIYFCHMYFASTISLLLDRNPNLSVAGGCLHYVSCSIIIFSLSVSLIYLFRQINFTKDIIGV